MVRALVTGSTGCVGSNLVAALDERGIEVVGLRWKGCPTTALEGLRVRLFAGDILDLQSLYPAMEGVDWVFHAAAIADDWNHSPADVYRTNVEGTRNVLTAARDAGVKRFVLTSSAASLGIPRPGKALLDESCSFSLPPRDWVYGHSKHLAERVLAEFVQQGLWAVSVLPTAVMGRGDLSLIGGQLVLRALKGQPFPFPEGGSNFIDVRDVAMAQIAAAERGRPGERYVLGGHNIPHRQAAGIIGSVLGVRVRYIQLGRWTLPAIAEAVAFLRKLKIRLPIDRSRVLLSGKYLYYDNGKAVRELGLKTRPFAESVWEAHRWYAEHSVLERHGIPASVPASRLRRLWTSRAGFHR
jgi:dihydroflavonol-4-reductase